MEQVIAKPGMRRGLDLWGVVALGLGTAMGVSIFSALGAATAQAGPGLLIAVFLAAVPVSFIAIVYAFMGTVLPTSGASYEWPRRFLNPAAAFFVAWLRIASNVGALIVLSLVMTRYLAMIIDVPVKPTMFLTFTLFFIANLLGVNAAANAQKFMMGGLLLLFAGFCLAGISGGKVQAAHFEPLLPNGWSGVLAAVPLLMNLFFGIESATELGDEISETPGTVALGILVSIGTAVVVYLAVAATCIGLVGADVMGRSTAPIVDAAQVALGDYGKPLVVVAACLAIAKSMNAIFMGFSRGLFAMGRSGALPAALGRIHPRWKSPHLACLAVYGLVTLGLFLPSELTFLFLAINVPIMFKYICVCLSARRALKQNPSLAVGSTLRAETITNSAGIGIAMAIVILCIGLNTDWRPYALLGSWAVIGAVYYSVRSKVQAN